MAKPSTIGINYTLPESRLDEIPLISGDAAPTWKRILDVSCVLLSLPLLVPIGLVIVAFIKLVSPGPAFFRQQRVGNYGKKFMCLKFRTMRINADTSVHQEHVKSLIASNHATKKLDHKDKRLIFGGMILRSLGVDELPQLINILRGEMSLVGPRPSTPFEHELYPAQHQRRCHAVPGLTGLWQVSGKNKTTFTRQMELDLYYVDNKNLWLDLKIIVLTVPAIAALMWEIKIRPRFGRSPADGPQVVSKKS